MNWVFDWVLLNWVFDWVIYFNFYFGISLPFDIPKFEIKMLPPRALWSCIVSYCKPLLHSFVWLVWQKEKPEFKGEWGDWQGGRASGSTLVQQFPSIVGVWYWIILFCTIENRYSTLVCNIFDCPSDWRTVVCDVFLG